MTNSSLVTCHLSPFRRFCDAAKWFLVGLLLGMAILNSKAADPWDTTDKVLAGTALLATVVDWGQTRTIARNPDKWYERNNLMGPHPSVGDVDKHFAIGIVAGAAIAHFLPSTARKWFLGGVTAIEVSVAFRNNSIGIQASF